MIELPWSVILTVLFTVTGLVCLFHWIRSAAVKQVHPEQVTIDVLHILMSIGMIVMVWWSYPDSIKWTQTVVFSILGIILLVETFVVRGARLKTDLVSHVVLSAAMVWMVVTMPLLMAGMDMSGMDMGKSDSGMADMDMSGSDMGGMDHSMNMATTRPDWVTAGTWIFVALSALCAIWWLIRIVRNSGHRMHSLCHILMGVGMGGMLILMMG